VNDHAPLLNRKQAAEYLGVKPHTLSVWACCKRYCLPYIKVGRLVKYRKHDLDAFLSSRTIAISN
jgi:excisionase family DNA binding protein